MKSLFLLILILTSFLSFGQLSKGNALFGLQCKPLIAGDFIGTSKLELKNQNLQGVFNQKLGYSLGGIIRVYLKEKIAIETGINQINRNYNINFYDLNTLFEADKNLHFLSYDIPVTGLFFVKLSDRIFMNTSLGPSFVFNPSNVATQIIVSDSVLFKAEGRRRSGFAVEFNANLGFELRTRNKGVFYIGSTARIPTAPIFNVAVSSEYAVSGNKNVIYGSLSGTYISFDIRYFFPIVKHEGTQMIKGPIEQ
jgi:hypothetical protein